MVKEVEKLLTENQKEKFWQIIEILNRNGLLGNLIIIGSWAEYLYYEISYFDEVEGVTKKYYTNVDSEGNFDYQLILGKNGYASITVTFYETEEYKSSSKTIDFDIGPPRGGILNIPGFPIEAVLVGVILTSIIILLNAQKIQSNKKFTI